MLRSGWFQATVHQFVDNSQVPFTLSHTAAALPFGRTRLIASALVVGTMAPDFEYFLALKAHDRFGHTLPGILVLTLPVSLLALWIFHAFVKVPAASLLPQGLQSKLSCYLGEFRFSGPGRFLLITFSVLIGIATHVLWDSFTHPGSYVFDHLAVLHQSFDVPLLGSVPWSKVLQHGSTVVGLIIISVWLFHWCRRSEGCRTSIRTVLSPSSRRAILAAGIALAVSGGIARALWGVGIPDDHVTFRRFIGEMVVTCMALAWWQLVGFGILSSTKARD